MFEKIADFVMAYPELAKLVVNIIDNALRAKDTGAALREAEAATAKYLLRHNISKQPVIGQILAQRQESKK